MRCWLLVAVVLGGLCGLTGCFNYSPEHNARTWSYMRKDFRVIAEDMHFWMGLDAPTLLDRTEY